MLQSLHQTNFRDTYIFLKITYNIKKVVYDSTKRVYGPFFISSEGPWAPGPWDHGTGPGPVGPWDRARGTMGPGPWDHGTGTLGPWDAKSMKNLEGFFPKQC